MHVKESFQQILYVLETIKVIFKHSIRWNQLTLLIAYIIFVRFLKHSIGILNFYHFPKRFKALLRLKKNVGY